MESIGRRKFFGVSFKSAFGLALFRVGLATTGAMILGGCDLEDEIAAWVKIGSSAIGTIITLLVNAGILACATCSVLANAAVAAINAIGVAVQTWKNNPSQTLLQKISDALQSALAAANSFFESVSIPDQQLATLIEGFVSLIVNAIVGYLGQLPAPTQPAAKEFKLGKKTLQIKPVVMKAGAFKSKWNALATQYNHPEAKL